MEQILGLKEHDVVVTTKTGLTFEVILKSLHQVLS